MSTTSPSSAIARPPETSMPYSRRTATPSRIHARRRQRFHRFAPLWAGERTPVEPSEHHDASLDGAPLPAADDPTQG